MVGFEAKGMGMNKRDDARVTRGSNNVFADLGLPDADELLVKAGLAHRIGVLIDKLTQVEAAKLLGIDQPKVSRLLRGELYGFSTEQLMRFLNDLGHDVAIDVKPKPKSRARGKTTVRAA